MSRDMINEDGVHGQDIELVFGDSESRSLRRDATRLTV